MVWMSQWDVLGSASQAPRHRASGTNRTTDVPGVEQRGGTQGLNSGGTEVARSGVCMRCATLTWFQSGAEGVWEGLVVSSNHTLLPAGEERGGREWQGVCNTSHTATRALLWPRDRGNCSFFENVGTAGLQGARGGTKTKGNKRFSTRPSSGEGVVRPPSPEEQMLPSLGRPSQGRLPLCLPPGLAGAWMGWAFPLRPAACRLGGGCCLGWAGTEAATGGHPRRQADGGTATDVWVKAAAGCWGRMCSIASVCFCAAENCWAKFSTTSPKRPAWQTGELRNRTLSGSHISARFSQRWRSWTTKVDIARPRERAVILSPIWRGPSLYAVPA